MPDGMFGLQTSGLHAEIPKAAVVLLAAFNIKQKNSDDFTFGEKTTTIFADRRFL